MQILINELCNLYFSCDDNNQTQNPENNIPVDTDATEDVTMVNNNLNCLTTATGNGQVGLNSRETTFQKLRERIMMNKLQRSNSNENSNPIRPSLYRKYPKRKPTKEKEKIQDIGFTSQPMDIKVNDKSVQKESKIATLEHIQRPVETDDYQRYFLQPINPYSTIPIQVPIKEEPRDEKPPTQIINHVEVEQVTHTFRNGDFGGGDVSTIEHKEVKRNLEPEFDDESNKKSTEEERIWLRALKEQGVKQVKETKT